MRAVKSNARKQNVGLTIPMATRQARRIVDQVAPHAGATVESRGSADPATLERVIVTLVTFPANSRVSLQLAAALEQLAGVVDYRAADASVVLTRTVR